MTNIAKLPAPIRKALEAHQAKWKVDDNELTLRLNNATAHYTKGLPRLGDNTSHALVTMHYKNLHKLIEGVTGTYSGYEINLKQTTPMSGGCGYRVGFIKPQGIQDKDLEKIERDITANYKAELSEIKEEFIMELIQEQAALKEKKSCDDARNTQEEMKKALVALID